MSRGTDIGNDKDFPQWHLASARLGDEAHTLALGMPVMGADWTLHKAAHFEISLATYSLEPEVTSVSERERIMQELHTCLAFYHEALPLSGGELRWLSKIAVDVDDKWGRRMGDTTRPFIEALRGSESTVLSGGIFSAVRGEDLHERWLSWKRGTNEFEGSFTGGVAYRGLLRMCALLKPGLV